VTTPEWFDDVLGAARTAFPDADYVSPGGTLSVNVDLRGIDTVRVEVPAGQLLQLQSADVTAVGLTDLASSAEVAVSSWHGQYGARFDPVRLFGFDRPTGTVIHTKADEPAWAELRFARAMDVTRIRLRNAPDAAAARGAGVRLLVAGRGGPFAVVYDAAVRQGQLEHLIAGRLMHDSRADPAQFELSRVIAQTLFGHYRAARTTFEAMTGLTEEVRRAYRTSVSRAVLADRQLEWTIHGPQRCFRFWTAEEKDRYLRDAVALCRDLEELTPHVSFGFGAALATVRDGDMIPHDDDLDVIVGIEPHEAANFPAAHKLIEGFLRQRGWTVSGNFMAHRHVSRDGRKHLDVFVGLFEDDTISWYPSARGLLDRDTMYPTSEGALLGVRVPLPRNPLIYLERVYGPRWRNPDPGFKHAWDRSSYMDLTRAKSPV
jgi:hypothetical protein